MTPNDYQRLASRTECSQLDTANRMVPDEIMQDATPNNNNQGLVFIRLNHAFAGISKQVGELWKPFIRHVYYGAKWDQVVRDNLKEELGDVLWHVAQACTALNLDLSEVMAANIRKLQARYPDKFTTEDAINRDTEAELKAIRDEGGPVGPAALAAYYRQCAEQQKVDRGELPQKGHGFDRPPF